MNWIARVLDATKHVETPPQFVEWSLYSAIAAVVSPNVSIDKQGAYDLYPNLYVMLTADTGVGKGFGVWLAKSLVKAVDNTRVFTGRNSIQKIVSELSLATTRKDKEMIKDGRGFLCSGEFINFLLKDDQAISILTEWYDTHYVKEWPNSLKSTGIEIIKGVNITVLGASNSDYLREAIPTSAIRGGFFGRLMFVHATEKGKVNALIDEATNEEKIADKIPNFAEYLKDLAKIKSGSRFKIHERAREFYRPWYYDLQEKIKTRKLEDKTGYIHRLHDHALKITMVLSLADSPELEITKHHVEEGIALAESLIPSNRKTTVGIGLSISAPKNEAFLRALWKAPDHRLTRKRLLQQYHQDFDSGELDRITLTMEDGGLIRTDKCGKEILYQLTMLGRREFIDIQSELKRRKS